MICRVHALKRSCSHTGRWQSEIFPSQSWKDRKTDTPETAKRKQTIVCVVDLGRFQQRIEADVPMWDDVGFARVIWDR